MADRDVIGVALLGMDARSKGLLRLYIGMLSKQRCEVVSVEDADVALIDFDSSDALTLLANVQRDRPDAAILGLAYGQSVPDGLMRLEKPVRGPELLAALHALSAKGAALEPGNVSRRTANTVTPAVSHTAVRGPDGAAHRAAVPDATVGAPDAADAAITKARPGLPAALPDNPSCLVPPVSRVPEMSGTVVTKQAKAVSTGTAHAALADRYGDPFHLSSVTASADPSATFEVDGGPIKLMRRVLAKVLGDGQSREIAHRSMPGAVIQFHPARGGTVTTSLGDGRLRALCISAMSMAPEDVIVRPCATPESGHLSKGAITADAMLWKLTLWFGRGRRPRPIAEHALVSMTHWPNLTRLLKVDHAARMCALLIASPRSMSDVARALEIDLATVHAFCGAAYALGLLKLHASVAPASIAPTEPPHDAPDGQRRRGLFGRILKHILR